MRKLLYFITFCLIFLNSYLAIADTNLKLVFALDLVRHGDRGPKKYMPKISNAWNKKETGQLTIRGKKQAELLGKNFREYYIKKIQLLPQNFQLNLIQVSSTSFQRAQDTARALVKGMFPSNSDKIHIKTYNIVDPKQKPKQISVITELQKDKALMNAWLIPNIKQQLKYINNIFSAKFLTAVEFKYIADLIRVSDIYNKPLLKQLPKKKKQEITLLASQSKLKFLSHPKIACLYGKDFITHVTNILDTQYKQKYFLYVGHDTNIITITSLLGYDLKNKLPYLSNLRFEVLKNIKNQKLFVRTSLDNRIVKICKSSDDCPLNEFITTLKNNVENKCRVI
ncbi:MAG: histidine-type phosphatase [Rickettsiales bacterium]|nr:histidine-type phosphatase [Rickettsiales bacterium]